MIFSHFLGSTYFFLDMDGGESSIDVCIFIPQVIVFFANECQIYRLEHYFYTTAFFVRVRTIIIVIVRAYVVRISF